MDQGHTSSRRRRLRLLLYFVLGLLLVDGVVRSQEDRWRRCDPDDYQFRLEGCQREHWDLVLVGSSVIAESADPAILRGLSWEGHPLDKVYNLGLPGATTSEVWHAVHHGLVHPPRVLVYGITASDLNGSRNEPHGPSTLMTWSDWPGWLQQRPDAAWWCTRHLVEEQLQQCWGLYRYRNGIRLWSALQLERCWPGTCPDAAAEARGGVQTTAALRRPDGYAPNPTFQTMRFDLRKASGWDGEPFQFLNNYSIGTHLNYLDRLIVWARDQQVRLVLVDMPVTDDLEGRRNPAEFRAYRQALRKRVASSGVSLLTAQRDRVGLTNADFADLIHLNKSGAARFSSWLRQELEHLSPPGARP